MRSTSPRFLSRLRALAAASTFTLVVGMLGLTATPSFAATSDNPAAPAQVSGPATKGSRSEPTQPRLITPNFTSGPMRLLGDTAPIASPAPENGGAGQMGVLSTGATGTAQIAGRVTSATNVGVAGSMVYASTFTGEYWAITDAQGNYVLENLPAGTYSLAFDQSVSKAVKNVVAGARITKIDARVALKAQIKGRVTGSNNAGISDVAVRVYSATDENLPAAWTFTDSTGNFFIHGLAAGSYRVHYETDYVTSTSVTGTWYGNAANYFTAFPLNLASAASSATGIDQELSSAGVISGTVTNASNQSPVSGISVAAYDVTRSWMPVSWGTTNAQGAYTLRHLPMGKYRVQFMTISDTTGDFAKTWYLPESSTDTFAMAQAVTISSSTPVAGIDQAMASAGKITGKVSAPSGAGIKNVLVGVYGENAGYEWITSTTTDAQGNYSLRGVPSGSYKLEFSTDSVQTGSFTRVWSGGKPTLTSADFVTLNGQSAVYNQTVMPAAQISGKVTNVAKAGVAGVNVMAIGPLSEWDVRGSTSTGPDGKYTIRGLASGKYKMRFDASYATGSYLSTWSGSATSFATASSLTLTATASKSGVDAKVAKAAQVSGTVTSQSNQPISGVTVSAVDLNSGESALAQTATNVLGKFTLTGLPAGSYKVKFATDWINDGSFSSGWFAGADASAATTQNAGTTVVLGTGAARVLGKTTLATAGTIQGTALTNTTNLAIANATVEAYLASDENTSVAQTTTDSRGRYSIRNLAPNTNFKLRLVTTSVTDMSVVGGWVTAATFADASTFLTSTAQATTADIGANETSTISGVIVDGNNVAVKGVRAEAFTQGNYDQVVSSAETDAKGRFVIRGLPTALYVVHIAAEGAARGHFLSQWSGQTVGNGVIGGLPENAPAWSITSSLDLTMPAITLTPSGLISGNVTNESGDPLEQVQVFAVSATGEEEVITQGTTDADGNYRLTGFQAGSYKLRFDPSNLTGSNLRETWFKNQDSFDSARVISLALSEEKTDADSEILAGAQATGKVTAKIGGKPISGVTVLMCPVTPGATCLSATTDATGSYRVVGIPAGRYRVQFDSAQATGSYLPAFWSDKLTWDSATIVTFASRQVRTLDYKLTAGATVTGRVTNQANQGIARVQVMTYSTATNEWIGASAFTDAQGYYTLKGVDSRGVKILFDANQVENAFYADEWNSDRGTWNQAATVTVLPGRTLANMNATLAPLTVTSISGTISPAGGGANAIIEVYSDADTLVTTVAAESDGYFAVTNMLPGDYRLKLSPAQNEMCHTSGWYSNGGAVSSYGAASDVSVQGRANTVLQNPAVILIMTDACA